ncbi:MAG: hypothetical protein IPG96_14435 [Proteobacteria bacterium]|nr:hypothetical protein [Pseudomonadota bacterium]
MIGVLLPLLALLALGAVLIPSFGVAQLLSVLLAGGTLAAAIGRRRRQRAGIRERQLATLAAVLATAALLLNLVALVSCQLRSWSDDERLGDQREREQLQQRFRRAVGTTLRDLPGPTARSPR